MSKSWWTPRWGVDTNLGPDAGWAAEPDADWSAHNEHASDDESLIEALEEQFSQIRSRDRVRDLAEVFTHQREIDAMLDMMPDAFENLDIKFLEPTCGSGNFLVEILRRKLKLVKARKTVSQEQYEHRMLRAVASIYGVDISPENVAESKVRMAHVLLEHYHMDANTSEPTNGFLAAATLIIDKNIVLGDALNDAWRIEMCDWQPRSGGCFQRVWSNALVPETEQGLFAMERVEDTTPIHYSELASKEKAAKEARWL